VKDQRSHSVQTGPRAVTHAIIGAALATACLAVGLVTAGAAWGAPGEVVWQRLSQRVPGGADEYRALAVTTTGTAYAAGSVTPREAAAADVLLVKHRLADGRPLWTRSWTYPGRSEDVALDVVRDRRGSIIVAGSSGRCWLLLKYSAAGYLQWVRRGRGPYNQCGLTAVAVDGPGNVYATGSATPAGGKRRILTVKYSSAGTFRWRTTAWSDAVDSHGTDLVTGGRDVYVTGVIGTGAGKCTTIRYSGLGKNRWQRTIDDDPSESTAGVAIGYAAGPIVMGVSTAAGTRSDGFVVRYTATGAEQWVAGHVGPFDLGDRFNAMAVDGSGRVTVTGTRRTGAGEEMFTVGFSALGSAEWEHAVAGATEGFAVCRAGSGACYSAGGAASLVVSQDTPAGLPGWQTPFSRIGFTGFRPTAAQAAGDTAVYVVGSAAPSGGGTAAMIVRYRP